VSNGKRRWKVEGGAGAGERVEKRDERRERRIKCMFLSHLYYPCSCLKRCSIEGLHFILP
jgi:hypothetical protein